ncbi:MAG TPA: hypothetical protein PKN99_06815, partial [Cyclobacteriaceae bacterium]|nr:hypothetical protein [Cyclobacteriaceae bacterium]
TVETRDGQVLIPTGGQGKTVAITDEAGNGYLVDKDGKVTKTTTTEAQLARARGEREYSTDENLKVDFLKAADTKYGLDLPQTVLAQNYQQTENGEYVAWKALEAGEEDHVAVAARGTGDITKANFKTGLDAQALTPNAETAGIARLNVMGKTDGQIDELLAFYPNPDTSKAELVAGKLNMISYDIEKKGLVLVSVNGTEAKNIGNLQQRLNEIYSQGVVEWISVGQEDLSVSGIDEKNIDDGGSGVLSNYTDDMKKILRAYTAYHTLADNTYYLFLVKNSISKSKLGYMPRKRQAGFIFVDAHNGQDMVLTMAHELGHGAFHLKHTFSEYSLSQGVTENLMDYPAKTRLDKWQWDKIHNPEAVLGLFEDDDEGALYSNAKMVKFLSSLRANNDNYAKNPDPGERAYLKENVVSEQDLKDQKVIDYFSDLSLYKFNPDYTASDPVIQGWLSLFNTSKDSEWKKLIENKANPVPYDQNPILLAREMEVETNTKEKFKLSMNGYSLSTKSITLYAHETKVGDDTKLTFFNGLIAPSGETNPNDEKNVINIRKSFDITVHSKNVQAFKDYIKLRGTIAPIDENPDSEEIIIDVVRKRSNNYITVSELSIRGTNIKGAALELGKGTEAESKASCTEYKADCYECKRVPAGEFAFDINTETTKQGQHKYKTIRLLKTDTHGSKRSGILIHMGDALSWTQGCLLAMYDNEIETIIQDDANIVSRIMGYGINIDVMNAGRAFILSMIEFIEEKEKRLGKSVTKKVIIKDDAQEKTLSINTSTFDLLQKANRYYYTEKLYDKAVKHFETFVTVLQQKAIHDRLNTELSEYTATLLPGLSKETFKESEIKELFGMKWGELLATHANYISLSDLMNSAILAQSDFSESLRASFAVFIKDQDVMNYLFHKTLKTSLHDNVTGFFEDRDGGKKKGFVSQNYTQELFDKILIESKVKLINQEIDKIVKAIEK